MTQHDNELKRARASIESEFHFSGQTIDEENWITLFREKINEMITEDFERLISVLYRLDVSETKLRHSLKEQAPDSTTRSAEIIGDLIIERQIQKMRSREQFRPDSDISEDEKW